MTVLNFIYYNKVIKTIVPVALIVLVGCSSTRDQKVRNKNIENDVLAINAYKFMVNREQYLHEIVAGKVQLDEADHGRSVAAAVCSYALQNSVADFKQYMGNLSSRQENRLKSRLIDVIRAVGLSPYVVVEIERLYSDAELIAWLGTGAIAPTPSWNGAVVGSFGIQSPELIHAAQVALLRRNPNYKLERTIVNP